MKPLPQYKQRRSELLATAKDILQKISNYSNKSPKNIIDALSAIERIRYVAYEELNQILHEDMILRASIYLKKGGYRDPKLKWYYHPRQTGSRNKAEEAEPDLKAILNRKTMLAVEVTTATAPKGSIDTWMRMTLEKLSAVPAEDRYYFVRTASMEKRAKTKLDKKPVWNIKVIHLGDEFAN